MSLTLAHHDRFFMHHLNSTCGNSPEYCPECLIAMYMKWQKKCGDIDKARDLLYFQIRENGFSYYEALTMLLDIHTSHAGTSGEGR